VTLPWDLHIENAGIEAMVVGGEDAEVCQSASFRGSRLFSERPWLTKHLDNRIVWTLLEQGTGRCRRQRGCRLTSFTVGCWCAD